MLRDPVSLQEVIRERVVLVERVPCVQPPPPPPPPHGAKAVGRADHYFFLVQVGRVSRAFSYMHYEYIRLTPPSLSPYFGRKASILQL